MTTTIIILTEDELRPSDVEQITGFYGTDDAHYVVLVPVSKGDSGAEEALDALWLGDFEEIRAALAPQQDDAQAEATKAASDLTASLAELQNAEAHAIGHVVDHDPVTSVLQAVEGFAADQIVVVTRPHFLEDTFHRDWASRIDKETQVPVLHIYGGTTRIVD